MNRDAGNTDTLMSAQIRASLAQRRAALEHAQVAYRDAEERASEAEDAFARGEIELAEVTAAQSEQHALQNSIDRMLQRIATEQGELDEAVGIEQRESRIGHAKRTADALGELQKAYMARFEAGVHEFTRTLVELRKMENAWREGSREFQEVFVALGGCGRDAVSRVHVPLTEEESKRHDKVLEELWSAGVDVQAALLVPDGSTNRMAEHKTADLPLVRRSGGARTLEEIVAAFAMRTLRNQASRLDSTSAQLAETA